LCRSVFSLFAVRMLAKPYHLGVSRPTTHCENKDGVPFFTLSFECQNRYNKLLLCNSENSDMAWWNKNKSGCLFSVLFEKRTKCFFSENQKQLFKKKRTQVGCCFEKKWVKPGIFSTLIVIHIRFPVELVYL